jgi:hypothetical protein
MLEDEVANYRRRADHLAGRLNAALRDLGLADPGENMVRSTEAGSHIVLHIPTTARADRFVREIEDLARVPS